MTFETRVKIRLWVAIIFLVLGLLLMAVGFWGSVEYASGLGLGFCVIGVARIRQYGRIMRNRDRMKQQEIRETDERNVMLWNQARSLTFSFYILLTAAAIIVFSLLGMEPWIRLLSYQLIAVIIIYWICYWVIVRKH